MNNDDLIRLLSEEIPLSNAIGVKIKHKSSAGVTLTAPLELNRNHLETAFGGSLTTLLILACYAWLFDKMDHSGIQCHVLIQEGQTKYLLPVKEDLVAICKRPDERKFQKFFEGFMRKGVGRINLEATIETKEGKGCHFIGVFIAQKIK